MECLSNKLDCFNNTTRTKEIKITNTSDLLLIHSDLRKNIAQPEIVVMSSPPGRSADYNPPPSCVTSATASNRSSAIETEEEEISDAENEDDGGGDDAFGQPGDSVAKRRKERQQWDKSIEFLFSCISMSVGLG